MMRRFLFSATAMVMAFVVVSTVVVPLASAQAVLTDDQRQQIRSQCVSIKSGLTQLKVSDALLRVNRGQLYESISAKLMDVFNGRVSGNGLDSRGLLAVTSSYDTALRTFQEAYTTYERQLSSAIAIDCSRDPDAFHAAIATAREDRQAVNEATDRINRLLGDYRSAVNDFRTNFQRVSGGQNE